MGRCLAKAELARLRLTLPVSLPDFLVHRLSTEPLLEARFDLPGFSSPSGASQPTRRRMEAQGGLSLVCFDVSRLLSEALDFEPGASLLAEGYLPFAGCGRRGTTLFLVTLRASSTSQPGEVHTVEGQKGARPSPLSKPDGGRLRFDELLAHARATAHASLRQRLRKKRPARAGMPRRREGERTARTKAATLSLFG